MRSTCVEPADSCRLDAIVNFPFKALQLAVKPLKKPLKDDAELDPFKVRIRRWNDADRPQRFHRCILAASGRDQPVDVSASAVDAALCALAEVRHDASFSRPRCQLDPGVVPLWQLASCLDECAEPTMALLTDAASSGSSRCTRVRAVVSAPGSRPPCPSTPTQLRPVTVSDAAG